MFKVKFTVSLLLLSLSLWLSATTVAQGTAFTYQGKLTDSGNLANGQYDFQFKLFDTQTVGTGTQIGSLVAVPNVTVTNGIFTVQLDFGACPTCFNGAARFLEIAVKPTSGSTFTTLGPRQPITSNPYAVRSATAGTADTATTANGLSVACVNCVTSSQIQSVQGSQVTGNIAGSQINGTIPVASVPAGSTNYIQNGTSQQASSNFNISGNAIVGGNVGIGTDAPSKHLHVAGTGDQEIGIQSSSAGGRLWTLQSSSGFNNGVFAIIDRTASAFRMTITSTGNVGIGIFSPAFPLHVVGDINTTTQYDIGGLRSFSVNGPFNDGLGTVFTASNTFVGDGAGVHTMPSFPLSDATGKFNAFFGAGAGQANTTGTFNSFFGAGAGFSNTTSNDNTFFGYAAGNANTTSHDNAFFGSSAGEFSTAAGNAFFGAFAGQLNTTGFSNAFFGKNAGSRNTTGFNNTFIGTGADFFVPDATGDNNTLLGASSRITSGVSNATAIGSRAQVEQSNSLILGSINGVNGATADTRVGIGTTTPNKHLHVAGAGDQEIMIESTDANGRQWTLQSSMGASNGRFEIIDRTANASRLAILSTGLVGIGTTAPADKLDVSGDVRVGTSGTNGCLKNNNGGTIVGTCSSDARFKRDIISFQNLLSRIVQLQPVYYYWRVEQFPDRHFGQAQEAGLIAQEVEKVLPELVTEDEQGYKAVNYSKLPLLTLQAIKELKAENDTLKQQLQTLTQQQQQLSQQQLVIDRLKKIVCSDPPNTELCK